MMIKEKRIDNAKIAKKIVLNSYVLSRKTIYDFVRPIKAKNGKIYFLCYCGIRNCFRVFDGETLKDCGEAYISIKNANEKILAEITKINIVSGHRKQGIGTQLIKFIEHIMKKKGVQQISLYASKSRTSTRHKVLEKWYTDMGYNKITESPLQPNLMLKSHLVYARGNLLTLKEAFTIETTNFLTKKRSKIVKILTKQNIVEEEIDKKCK